MIQATAGSKTGALSATSPAPPIPRVTQEAASHAAGKALHGGRPAHDVAAHSSSALAAEVALPPAAEPAVPDGGFLQQFLHAYDVALQSSPVRTKALTSFVGFALGDAIAQGVAPEAFDALRCGGAAAAARCLVLFPFFCCAGALTCI